MFYLSLYSIRIVIEKTYVTGDFSRKLIVFIQVFASPLEYDHS